MRDTPFLFPFSFSFFVPSVSFVPFVVNGGLLTVAAAAGGQPSLGHFLAFLATRGAAFS